MSGEGGAGYFGRGTPRSGYGYLCRLECVELGWDRLRKFAQVKLAEKTGGSVGLGKVRLFGLSWDYLGTRSVIVRLG